jgi:hypothetical protein
MSEVVMDLLMFDNTVDTQWRIQLLMDELCKYVIPFDLMVHVRCTHCTFPVGYQTESPLFYVSSIQNVLFPLP